MNKNQQCIVKIEDMSDGGEGIGKFEGYTLFVKDAIVGDLAKVKVTRPKKNYGYARLEEILTPSPYRVEPACPHHRRCGGCQLQAMDYRKQLEWKLHKVKNNLERIGGLKEVPIREIIGMKDPYRYRNKAQYPVGWTEIAGSEEQKNSRQEKPESVEKRSCGRIITGFYAGRTHVIIDSEDCLIGQAVNGEILRIIKAYMEEQKVMPYDERTGKGLVRHVLIRTGYHTGEIMVCMIVNGNSLPKEEKLAMRLREIPGMTSIMLNVNRERTNVILGKEVRTLWGKSSITDKIGNVEFSISPLSFFQVNPLQTEKLYRRALEYAGGKTKNDRGSAEILEETNAAGDGGNSLQDAVVWDLYCGIGTISLFLAQKAKQVYGVEIVPAAVEDARRNAAANGMTNVEFFVGRAEEVVPRKFAEEGIRADVVVVDPPRKGCDGALLETIVKMAPKRVVYVSCDSATMARDVKYLVGNGYEVKEVTAVDMFPMTVGVETVVQLSKGEIQSKKIRVDFSLEDMDMSGFQKGATYGEIKAYVKEHTGLTVSSLYIAQVKQKCGIIERENYNKPKSENAKQPQCPPEKEAAIREALKHFRMI